MGVILNQSKSSTKLSGFDMDGSKLTSVTDLGARRPVVKTFSGCFGMKKPSVISAEQQGYGVFKFSASLNPCTVVTVDVFTCEVHGSVLDPQWFDKKDIDHGRPKPPALYVLNNGLNFVVRDSNHPWFVLKFALVGDDEVATAGDHAS